MTVPIAMQGMLNNKPSVIRGSLQNGMTPQYVFHGFRKNPLERDIGEYAFNDGVSEWEKHQMKEGLNNLVGDIEKRGLDEMKEANLQICAGYADFSKFRKSTAYHQCMREALQHRLHC
jgi:hypothetical protein